ncbi:MAG: exosome complex protein Rrp42 [Ferroplasma sp.]|uniref:exosome complex protein Rrp42 n=1 Tax=Ferroplasma sp. TaxID=2591003 RepID=UPI002815E29F|nr:exosome complex protein Rrp42 [Ferroplasma sp.]WMT51628.1 MAG: exosome complex protein Rrp42 [Ferroplasma sp.]
MPMDASAVLSEIRKGFILESIKTGKRLDGRRLDDYREIKITENFVPKAAGSAMVEIGKTKVVAGIKVEEGDPFEDSPDSGVMALNIELLPMAFPTFESGPPSEQAIEYSRVVDRGIRESKMVDTSKLVIESGKRVWMIFVDIDVLNYDGNIIDAATLAAVTALKNTVVPASKIGQKDYALPVNATPVSVTMVKIGDELVCDPDLEEEQVSNGRITVTISEDHNIHAMQKGDIGEFSLDEIRKAIKTSSNIGNKLRETYLR